MHGTTRAAETWRWRCWISWTLIDNLKIWKRGGIADVRGCCLMRAKTSFFVSPPLLPLPLSSFFPPKPFCYFVGLVLWWLPTSQPDPESLFLGDLPSLQYTSNKRPGSLYAWYRLSLRVAKSPTLCPLGVGGGGGGGRKRKR